MLFIRSFYQDTSKVNIIHEGNALRVAYLIGDIAVAAGTTYMSIDFERQFAPNAPDRFKRHTIEIFCEQLNPPYPREDFKRFYKQYLEIKAIKHKGKQEILLERSAIKVFEGAYTACCDLVRHSLKYTGLADLNPMLDTEELYLHGNSISDPESTENNFVPVTEMLREKWTADDEWYIITHPFGDFLKEKTQGLPAGEADNMIWSIPLCHLPTINYLTVPELRLIREQAFSGLKEMRKNMEDWSASLLSKKFKDISEAEFESFYNSSVLPFKHDWEERQKDCETLAKAESFYRSKAGSEILLCLTSAKTMLDYWEWSGSVPAVSIQKFRSALPEGCSEDSAVPFLLCNNFDTLHEIYEEGDKKSLEL